VNLGVETVPLDIPQTIIAIATLAAAIGLPAWIAARRSRAAADRSASAAEQVIEKVSPSNGADKLVDEINARFDRLDKAVEFVSGRMHDVSKRVDGIDRDVKVVKETVEHTNGRVGVVEKGLTRHLTEVDPLIERAQQEWGSRPEEEER